ncbi:MAG: O-antigen translocase [Proteiniphilum sp.]|jgi:O-antigen/teichoic acid export membrane protein|uniref:O-antigen translocase n=1 Tax=Proteiniphilum sp. TaxID=1926877 RepID=UPI00092663B6|nr:O-antigen translocase [Proteiniphilum sp.]MEA5126992.1 O-antigen translocase [Proteiniphilum sp.]OJV81860.1 MAG: O-antigen translocase [Bacteroidia bacterium 44-10]
MTEQKDSYRQIMKATSLFGGVQVFQILISVIRSKFVAILLGPAGMGIVGLLASTTGLIAGLTGFGLGTSGVKNVTEAYSSGNKERIDTVVSVVRRLVWLTGLLGAMLTLVFSPWLSEFAFGNKEYTLAFVWLSITLLFAQLNIGEMVVLQGMRKLQYLAKANIYGSLSGLVVAIPLYYKLGIRGIVPVIIITAFMTFFFSRYFARKVKTEKVKLSLSATITEGKSMMVMGFMISMSAMIILFVDYLLRIFINHIGHVEDVGFYNAGFAIINTYVGMVFTAMGTDYYPRLSVVADNNQQCKDNINQQAEIALLILAPILIIFLIFVNWAVVLLYSKQFLVITDMLHWAALGIFFKAVSWSIAFVFLAKGEGKLYFWSEFASSMYTLIFNMLGYYLGGLTGLGVSFLLSFTVYLIQVFVIARTRYHFSFYSSFITIFLVQFTLALLTFALVNLVEQPYSYFWGIVLIAISGWYSYRELDRRIGVKEIIQSVIQKIKKRHH